MKKIPVVIIIGVLCLSMLSAFAPKVMAQSSADWPMFRAGPSHGGAGVGNPALALALNWSYSAHDEVHSSPAVVDGVVYVGFL